MDAPAHIQRMIAEALELRNKIAKLKAFTETVTFKELPELEALLLSAQLNAMLSYANCLTARLHIWESAK